MAVVYPDIHVFVLDEVTAPDLTAHFSPDYVAVDALELRTIPPLPPQCHRLAFAPTPTSVDEDRTILFTHDWRPPSDDIPHMYVPVASLVFSDSLAHTWNRTVSVVQTLRLPMRCGAVLQRTCDRVARIDSLFNAKAFIHCGRFKSLEACAVFVMEVHQSPTKYEAMRKEKPVVNTTAFYDVFSWHPDVRRALGRLEGRPDMAKRLGDLITSV